MMTTPGTPQAVGNRGSDHDVDDEGARENYELLAATIIGVVAGAGLALLLQQGRGRRHRARHALVRLPAKRRGHRRGHRARHAADALLRRRRRMDGVGEALGDQLAAARAAIDEVVAEEVKDLRKAIRQQRKRLGV